MTGEMIINSKDEREKLIKRVDVLDKVKKLLLLPGTDWVSINQVADYYEVTPEWIKELYGSNKEEIDSDGTEIISRDFYNGSKLKPISIEQKQTFVIYTFEGGKIISINNRGLKAFSKRAVLRIRMLLQKSEVAKEVRTQLLNIEEKTSGEIKVSSIAEEEKLLMNIALAYKSGEIDKLMAATSAYSKFQSRYIQKLEQKAKIADEMINDSSVTAAITQRIKDTDVAKKWNKELKNDKLSKTTLSVLSFVHDFINENGFSPTVREICNGVGLKSTSSVHSHMNKLDDLGYLVKDYKKPRNIRINEEKYVEAIK